MKVTIRYILRISYLVWPMEEREPLTVACFGLIGAAHKCHFPFLSRFLARFVAFGGILARPQPAKVKACHRNLPPIWFVNFLVNLSWKNTAFYSKLMVSYILYLYQIFVLKSTHRLGGFNKAQSSRLRIWIFAQKHVQSVPWQASRTQTHHCFSTWFVLGLVGQRDQFLDAYIACFQTLWTVRAISRFTFWAHRSRQHCRICWYFVWVWQITICWDEQACLYICCTTHTHTHIYTHVLLASMDSYVHIHKNARPQK